MKLGCHVSIAKGLKKAVAQAASIDAQVIQFFSRNPRGGKAKKLDEQLIKEALELASAKGVTELISHAPYTINLCSNKEDVRQFAVNTLAEDLQRMELCGCKYLVTHPGSHVKQGAEEGKELLVKGINYIHNSYEGQTMLLLETMAGQGTEMGATFAQMAEVIEQLEQPERVGLCLDTCHLFASGYSITNPDKFIEEVTEHLPLEKIKVVHLNDSKFPAKSHKDRHAPIGSGELGWDSIINLISHSQLNHLPYILETPGDLDHYGQELIGIRQRLDKI